ncbi:Bug family tripartite tricarboxylate transporter substrate binding protein [Aquabacterium sp. J223]|uniref:Bug family tripartite tricarboxylate transporter substrate binding protein n=1 Tax=Aquabacterium sp. J223 TaxID=2898431 RepID=UPI0021AD8038|nr:tripartite tricarboxylate transporter substrate binding protein [Aquabacterium sp. J223]UUX94491.1 tripartite tricarboxylate transporter substrate binding protein [Aquabacterium sp. J223]
MPRRRFTLPCALAWALLAGAGPALAQAAFPNKPVRIIVPFPAGGTADAIPRIVSERLSAMWGQPVVIDNRPGAGGNVGAELAFRAEPDGYTLLASPPGPLAVNASLYKKLTYDVTKFMPVSLLATMPNVLAVRSNLPAQDVQQLIAMAQKEPGKVTFATQGNGTTSHLTGALFQQRTNTSLVHVPYKGTAPALTDLAGGQVDMMFDNISSTLGQYKAGRVKVLAVATAKRLPSIPEVPTMEEAGVRDFRTGTWVAVVAPPNTPAAITAAISKAMAEVVKTQEVQKRFADLGGEGVGGTPAELATFLAAESARWREVVQRANVSVD